MTTREITYASSQVLHPEYRGSARLWQDPEVSDIVHKLHHGDPTLGWEGDPRLALYLERGPAGQQWVLERLERDGKYRRVCRAKPGVALDNSLIMHLVAHDMRRKKENEFLEQIDKVNAQVERAEQAAAEEKMQEAFERVVYALDKDVGHHYG